MPQKFQQIICDDVIEQELPDTLHPGNNAFALVFNKDASVKDQRKCTLYKEAQSSNIADETLKSFLGRKRARPEGDLCRAFKLKSVRDYAVTQQEIAPGGEFLVVGNSKDQAKVHYIPLASKLNL